MGIRIKTFLAVAACWGATALFAADNSPKHVVLVYSDARPAANRFNKEDYVRLAAFVDSKGKPVDALFDSFLILGLKAKSGDALAPGFGPPIQKEDYEWFLGRLFEEGGQVASLDEAVRSLPSDLRTPRQVILAIPYPFQTFSNQARLDMVRHFVGEAARRFEQGHFAGVHLAGFYWLNESMTEKDLGIVKETAQLVHARRLKFYWIPYFTAKGLADWRSCGFDHAMLQPNYAFRDVKTNRFAETEALRLGLGMTIEMEVAQYTRNRPESPAWKDSFAKYLSAGLKYDWEALDCVGYYNGNDLAAMSRQPQNYPYYEVIHKFIRRTLSQEDLDRLAADAASEPAAHGKSDP
jgi:hypothetical protein